MLVVQFVYFPEKWYHLEQQCRIDSIALTFDFVPVIFHVMFDLQLWFIFASAPSYLRFQIELSLATEVQKNHTLIQKVDFVMI